jgi:hypothetical protein
MSKPFASIKTSPVVTARKALEDVLKRAIKSKDDAAIVTAATKVLQQFKEETLEASSSEGRLDPLIEHMTAAEKTEIGDLVFKAAVVRATVALRLGVKPLPANRFTPADQKRILEAARGRLA